MSWFRTARLFSSSFSNLKFRTTFTQSFCSSFPRAPIMTESTPASEVPRYLTGDKAGLREFLAKFDVSLP